MNVIDVSGLTKRFGTTTVVDNISLRVREREIVGFLGPNGSGKTTTIRMLCGLLRPDAAAGSCLGFDVLRDAEHIRLQTGYMTQKFSFYEDLTIRGESRLRRAPVRPASAPAEGRGNAGAHRSRRPPPTSSPERSPAAGSSASRSRPA